MRRGQGSEGRHLLGGNQLTTPTKSSASFPAFFASFALDFPPKLKTTHQIICDLDNTIEDGGGGRERLKNNTKEKLRRQNKKFETRAKKGVKVFCCFQKTG
eukprot:GEMP01044208.1.p2 GENE.GEMP01044208.1~~GEMP01044208.1.p2  ORF type:complete len:101 (+),score=1.85 GEMP01044208.1:236-538(+)